MDAITVSNFVGRLLVFWGWRTDVGRQVVGLQLSRLSTHRPCTQGSPPTIPPLPSKATSTPVIHCPSAFPPFTYCPVWRTRTLKSANQPEALPGAPISRSCQRCETRDEKGHGETLQYWPPIDLRISPTFVCKIITRLLLMRGNYFFYQISAAILLFVNIMFAGGLEVLINEVRPTSCSYPWNYKWYNGWINTSFVIHNCV